MKDASLIAIFAAEAGEPVPEWHTPIPPTEDPTMITTDTDIRILSREAAEAGDLRMAMICDLALGGPRALDGAEPGTDAADLLAEGMTQSQARAECARVIAEAQDRAADSWDIFDPDR